MHKQKKNLAIWVVGLLIAAPLPAQAQGDVATKADRVLLVVSSHGADGGKTRPGFEMDELSQAYAVFADNGLTVDIASPAGGVVVADEFDPKKPYNSRFIADPAASAKLASTLALAKAASESYAAVFVVGGKGAMFDLPVNTDLKTLIAQTYEAGGVIGAVCHGPAALMNVPLKDGTSLIAGRAVTGFSNEEELLFGKRWVRGLPRLARRRPARRGRTVQRSADDAEPCRVRWPHRHRPEPLFDVGAAEAVSVRWAANSRRANPSPTSAASR